MGFLKMKRMCAISILLSFLVLDGCNRLSLRQSLNQGRNDIPMYGYTIARNNTSISDITPPLDSIWKVDLGAGTGVYPPAVVDSMLFVGNLRGEILAINIRTGDVEGKKKIGSAIAGTPVVNGDVVYAALTGSKRDLVAYNFRASAEVWKLKIGDVESSPLLWDSKLYFGTLNGDICCVDAETGGIDWKYPASSDSKKRLIRSSPASDGDRIVFCCDDGTIISMEKNGTMSWESKTEGSIVASPAIFGENVYVSSADSCLYCFSMRAGSLEWKKNLGAGIYASPAVSAGGVVVGCVDGTVWCLDGRSGEKLWKKKTDGVIAGAPVISGSLIYLGNLNHILYTLLLENGDIADEFTFSGRIRTSPLIYGRYLFLVVESRSLIAFHGGYQQ